MKSSTTARAIAVTALALLLTTACNRRTFSVPTSSMAPTISAGSQIVVDMTAYSAVLPQRWDIILFDPPPFAGKGQAWVMRVVGLPGEQVSFAPSGGLLINGEPLAPPPELATIPWQLTTGQQNPAPLLHPFSIPPESYYVLGDNTTHANDSRFWGAVPRRNILGKVVPK